MILHYIGSSMNPLLKPGERLKVIPCRFEKIRIGDVIVFRHPEEKHYIVHRVVSITLTGVRTRGDNNPKVDEWVLSPDNIIGYVDFVHKRKGSITIYRGLLGRLFALTIRMKRTVNLTIVKIPLAVFFWVVKLRIVRQLLSHQLKKTKVVCFQRPKGIEMQLIKDYKVIGRRLPGKIRWQIRRRFRLFIDGTSLPDCGFDQPKSLVDNK